MSLTRFLILTIRWILPLATGICLGLSVSFLLLPFLKRGKCDLGDEILAQDPRVANSYDLDARDFKYGYDDDYSPRRLENSDDHFNGNTKKVLRHRYISTELGIKDKLFVAVLSSQNGMWPMVVALNKTMGHMFPKLVYFLKERVPQVNVGMSVVSIAEQYHLVFHMFRYIAKHYGNRYDFYFFATDQTFINTHRFLELVSNLNGGKDVYLGTPHNQYCKFDAGIIISHNILKQISENLDWCMLGSPDSDIDVSIGRCIQKATGQVCSDISQFHQYVHFNMDNISLEDHQELLEKDEKFNNAVTLSNIAQERDFYLLHRYFSELEIKRMKEEIERKREIIKKLNPMSSDGNISLSWPIGTNSPVSPKTRFDVLEWVYFTDKHIYMNDELSNKKELTGLDYDDVQDVISVSLDRLQSKYEVKLSIIKLVNGYRRFDHNRGMEYILDLLLFDESMQAQVTKRVNLLRPVSNVEIVPMPYVTESTKINLVLPVTSSNKNEVVNFLDTYALACLDSGDNTNLFVVFVYEEVEIYGNKDDPYAVLKSMISYYESKYTNGDHISWIAMHNVNPSQISIMDVLSERNAPDVLFLLCTVGMELSTEFLNRVRMNTIIGWQAFFPIGFWQYKPNLVYEEKPYPTTIDINKKVGHFDKNAYEHVSFYNEDFISARRKITKSVAREIDLLELFMLYHNIHVFRAVEPSLHLRYRERVCRKTTKSGASERCLNSRTESLASQSQLAMLVLEHQQKMNQAQLFAVQKQNNQNVQQMKPNMM